MDILFFNCPHCTTQFEIQPEWAGMEVSCPVCRKSFVIPKNVAGSVPVMPPVPPPSSPGAAPVMPPVPPPQSRPGTAPVMPPVPPQSKPDTPPTSPGTAPVMPTSRHLKLTRPGTAPVMPDSRQLTRPGTAPVMPDSRQLTRPGTAPVMPDSQQLSQLGNPIPVTPDQSSPSVEAGEPSGGIQLPRNRQKLVIRKNLLEQVSLPPVPPVQPSDTGVPVPPPEEPTAEVPPVQPPQSAPEKNRKAEKAGTKKEKNLAWLQSLLKIILLLGLIAGGFYLYQVITAPTPKSLEGNQLYAMTQKRANPGGHAGGMQDIVKHDFFPIAGTKRQFFYRTAQFTNISLKKIDNEQFEGTIYFTRENNKKVLSRPVTVSQKGRFTHYRFPFKYADHPEYLYQDADLIFSLAVQLDPNLQGWKFVSGRVAEKNTLVCIMTKDDKRKRIRLKAEQVVCDDNIGRIWVEIVRKKK